MVSAAAAGLAVVGFTRLTEQALQVFFRFDDSVPWMALAWMPASAFGIAWLTRRYVPGAGGSGIPQVIAALSGSVATERMGLFVSLRLTVAKILLTSWGLLAGLSLGREGPSVQIAAGIMLAGRRWLPRRSAVSEHGLLVAGGAAGIAAAFNTPLAGVMFAIEELSRTPEQRSSGLLITGIVLAGIVAVSINGNETYFGMIRVHGLGIGMLLPGVGVALASGIAGGLFARLLIASLGGRSPDRATRWRSRHPAAFAAACGLACAVIGLVTRGATFGSGYTLTRSMLEGQESVPTGYTFFKFVATWLTTWSGVPAGIFAPSLAIGAGIGNGFAECFHLDQPAALIALGMAGFLAAVTQAPLTAFIIVMEMVDGHSMVLTLMACSLAASAISRVLTRPLYGSLAEVQLLRLAPHAASPTGGATPVDTPT